MQWLQHPHERILDNLNNVRCKASGGGKEYLKAKIDELGTNSKI